MRVAELLNGRVKCDGDWVRWTHVKDIKFTAFVKLHVASALISVTAPLSPWWVITR